MQCVQIFFQKNPGCLSPSNDCRKSRDEISRNRLAALCSSLLALLASSERGTLFKNHHFDLKPSTRSTWTQFRWNISHGSSLPSGGGICQQTHTKHADRKHSGESRKQETQWHLCRWKFTLGIFKASHTCCEVFLVITGSGFQIHIRLVLLLENRPGVNGHSFIQSIQFVGDEQTTSAGRK